MRCAWLFLLELPVSKTVQAGSSHDSSVDIEPFKTRADRYRSSRWPRPYYMAKVSGICSQAENRYPRPSRGCQANSQVPFSSRSQTKSPGKTKQAPAKMESCQSSIGLKKASVTVRNRSGPFGFLPGLFFVFEPLRQTLSFFLFPC